MFYKLQIKLISNKSKLELPPVPAKSPLVAYDNVNVESCSRLLTFLHVRTAGVDSAREKLQQMNHHPRVYILTFSTCLCKCLETYVSERLRERLSNCT